ncbi:MAG: hypothetical protein AAB632_01170 [Patescibacteria group bacterium]
MNVAHKELASGRWSEMSFCEQMANVGSEVERAISWRKKGNTTYSYKALERALELLDLTIKDAEGKGKMKELFRLREFMADYFVFDNEYKSTDKSWNKYFYSFIYTSRMNR